MAAMWMIHPQISSSSPVHNFSEDIQFSMSFNWNRRICYKKFVVKAVSSDHDRSVRNDAISTEKLENGIVEKPLLDRLQESVSSAPVFILSIRKISGANLVVGLCVIASMVIVLVRAHRARQKRYNHQGSVADLVRRGQLRSDRRGISTPLKYDDPFNNPMVKVSKNNSSVEMYGKVYRLAPVTLTVELQAVHQNRRSRAYQWKRPTIFLKEGESIPPDVDPDTVRWIPANHPFATTSSDIDEDLAQTNVHQKHGVPFRIQAEHEALQNEQKLHKLVIDPAKSDTNVKPGSDQHPTSARTHSLSENKSVPEGMHNLQNPFP